MTNGKRISDALRHCATVHDCSGCDYGCDTNGLPRNRDLLNDAADAIEELIKTSRRLELEAAANEKDKQYLVDENRRLVDSLMNLLVQKWISVEERLLEIERSVLLFNGAVHIGWRVDGKRFRFLSERFPDHPTHWMPLPEPPKEVE